jgi:hypothetical protein
MEPNIRAILIGQFLIQLYGYKMKYMFFDRDMPAFLVIVTLRAVDKELRYELHRN